MSSENDDLAAPLPGAQLMINGVAVHIAEPPPPPLRERFRKLRADFRMWLAGAPLAPGDRMRGFCNFGALSPPSRYQPISNMTCDGVHGNRPERDL